LNVRISVVVVVMPDIPVVGGGRGRWRWRWKLHAVESEVVQSRVFWMTAMDLVSIVASVDWKIGAAREIGLRLLLGHGRFSVGGQRRVTCKRLTIAALSHVTVVCV
jgi:hypothetical protein